MGYYGNVNPDLLELADLSAARILEIGCGSGALAHAITARHRPQAYIGVELFEDAAKTAREVMDTVIVGDIEDQATLDALDAASGGKPFDLLLIGDVLEHMHDPWRIMAEIGARMAAGGQARICIPNVAHWSLLLKQMKGDWTYADQGLLDRTHLRWFTRDTAADMFRGAGWQVDGARPRIFNRSQGMAVVRALADATGPLGLDPAVMQRNLLPLQWVFSLSRPDASARPIRPLQITGLGMQTEHDAMVEVRLGAPLRALNGTGRFATSLITGKMPADIAKRNGVLWLYRMHVGTGRESAQVQAFIDRGGLLIVDMDDNPEYLPNHTKNDFRTLRNAHALTASTSDLAQHLRQWNPEVHVVENAVMELPQLTTPASDPRLHLFFGALNRTEDWQAQCGALIRALEGLRDQVRATVLFDEDFAAAIEPHVDTVFHRLLPYQDYLKALAGADLVLMPLRDTAFNRVKSDLKVVESLARGAVPLCSELVAGISPVPDDFLRIARTEADWAGHLQEALRDREALRAQGLAGRAHIGTHRLISAGLRARAELLHKLVQEQPRLEAARQARLTAWQARREVSG